MSQSVIAGNFYTIAMNEQVSNWKKKCIQMIMNIGWFEVFIIFYSLLKVSIMIAFFFLLLLHLAPSLWTPPQIVPLNCSITSSISAIKKFIFCFVLKNCNDIEALLLLAQLVQCRWAIPMFLLFFIFFLGFASHSSKQPYS